MTKTLSLPLCRKLSEMGIEVEAEKNWNVYPEVPVVQEKGNFGGSAKDMTPYFLRICELYASTGSLGEGSEAERYLIDLIK